MRPIPLHSMSTAWAPREFFVFDNQRPVPGDLRTLAVMIYDDLAAGTPNRGRHRNLGYRNGSAGVDWRRDTQDFLPDLHYRYTGISQALPLQQVPAPPALLG